ncbi:MAG: hypothetical protein ABI639_11540 [Thermoanaerobaculia bacterium]
MILATTLASAMVSSSFAFLHSTWGRPADPRIRVYRDIGAWLRSHTLPQSRVAAVEIGALAYFSDRPVLDLAGLIDPELRTARHEGRLRAAVDAERFDYLVWNSAFDGNFLAQLATSRALELDYRRVATFSRPEYPRTIQLLQRKR